MASNSAISQALQWAYDAGFRGLSLVYVVAIAIRESGLNPTARCYNVRDPATGKVTCYPGGGQPPPAGVRVLSVDRGILQINSAAHPNISDAMADDPASAFRAAYQISARGTNFKAWVAYTTGAFRNAVAQVATLAGVTVPALPPVGQTFAYTDPSGAAGSTGTRPPVVAAGWQHLLTTPFDDFLGGIGSAAGGLLSGITSKARKEIIAGVSRIAITGTLLAGGVALVVIGAYRAVQPAVQKRTDEAVEKAGQVAKVAAAVA